MRVNLKWLTLSLIPLAALAVGLLVVKFSESRSSNRPQATSYEGTELAGSAPDFQLLDRNGASVALSNFLGNMVVLTFLDSRCTDVCPLTALHLRLA